MAERQCRNCGSCCITMGIKEIDSQPYSKPRCLKSYTGGSGRCSIYDSKPGECNTFQCGWLEGLFEDRHRPDLSGLICHATGPENMAVIALVETRPGAAFGELGLEMRAICKANRIPLALVRYRDMPRLGQEGDQGFKIAFEGRHDQVRSLMKISERIAASKLGIAGPWSPPPEGP